MRSIKETHNKQIKSAFERHQKSVKFELIDCYKKASLNKHNVFNECINLMRLYDGFDLRIIGHNSMVFTVGFFGYINNRLNFFYITPEKIQYMEI